MCEHVPCNKDALKGLVSVVCSSERCQLSYGVVKDTDFEELSIRKSLFYKDRNS